LVKENNKERSYNMDVSTSVELAKENRQLYDQKRDIVFVNLNSYLTDSFNDYIMYITENELKLTRKEKNKLGVHFIIKQLLNAVNSTKTKKWFYYRVCEGSEETKLVKRIFGSLPTNIMYDECEWCEFIQELDYNVYKKKDGASVSFQKFRQFLKRYELQQLEKEFLGDINVKLSLLP
tara:strand:- start:1050 stop:1583 length:534 start_codon:yes stop_codon:yes gene_type:complete